MNKLTRSDLKIRQSQPLEIKIRMTEQRVKQFMDYFDNNCYLSFSGGKDSTVLKHIIDNSDIVNIKPQCVFVDTGLEWPEVREFVKKFGDSVTWIRPDKKFTDVIRECGYPVISKEVAHTIYYAKRNSHWAKCRLQGVDNDGNPSKYRERYKKYAYLTEAPFLIGGGCCDELKKRPVKKFEHDYGLHPIVATMAEESIRREQAYLRSGCNSFESKRPISEPMAFWTEQDVLEYIQLYNVQIASIYGDIVKNGKGKFQTTGESRTGCMFCMFGEHREKEPNKFQRMAITHPKQYDFCIRPLRDNGLGLGEVLDFIHIPYKPKEPDGNNTPRTITN